MDEKTSPADDTLCVFCLESDPDLLHTFDFTFTMKRGSKGGKAYKDIPCHSKCLVDFKRDKNAKYSIIGTLVCMIPAIFICKVDFTNWYSILIGFAFSAFVGIGLVSSLLSQADFEKKYEIWRRTQR